MEKLLHVTYNNNGNRILICHCECHDHCHNYKLDRRRGVLSTYWPCSAVPQSIALTHQRSSSQVTHKFAKDNVFN